MTLGQHIKTEHSRFLLFLTLLAARHQGDAGRGNATQEGNKARPCTCPSAIPNSRVLAARGRCSSSQQSHQGHTHFREGMWQGETQWHRLNLPYWIFEANVSPERKKSKNCEDSMTQDTHTPGTASLRWPQSLGLLHTQGPDTSKVAFTGQSVLGEKFFFISAT